MLTAAVRFASCPRGPLIQHELYVVGRPRSLESDEIRSVRNAALAGTPKAQIAREHGISRSTLYRYLEQPELPLT